MASWRRTLVFLAGLLAARPLPAAECPELLNAIRLQAWERRGREVSCADLGAAVRLLPLEEGSAVSGEWAFAGEKSLRAELRSLHGIIVPGEVLPLGALVRDPPDAAGLIAVFALAMPDRLAGLLTLAGIESAPRDRLAQTLGGGAAYDRLGLYGRAAGRPFPAEGLWMRLPAGGLWGQHAPAPEGVPNCLPCSGWLCSAEPVACLNDLDYDGRPELHLAVACGRPPCGMRVVSAAGGKARLVASSGEPGDWEERGGAWLFKPRPRCRGGEFCGEGEDSLGDPTCERPQVFRLDARRGRLVPDPGLREEFHPESEKPLPRRCRGERPGTVVWTPEGGFVRYK